ncbi:hypothetical protein DI005_16940 [Prauserella sp. PE36]|uniref:Uncharacterized protein n=1 Tax=Prauserella endophytica TaxID=1592324 RepID=A0ABY2SBW7_9PSEU|nr:MULTISPECIES: DUF6474 family protein [Prauserella]PXY34865.1 hypothetical protein BAY59_05075 [Prauserella coralliicola]RBM19356.1 hypothetical protein DI005_16940 [Prauserella sp. PE36]TKG73393.1 hypothetical protein FCN18_02115 [Prauserella endophytica]
MRGHRHSRDKAAEPAGNVEHESALTPKKAKNAVRVAKVIIPAAVPVVAPLAVRAAGAARDAYDRYQARRMGISVEQLSEYTGRGGALLARIAGAADGLTELRRSPKVTDDDLTFAERGQSTLEQLAASVRAAERMPAARRKAAHRAVAAELEHIESQLLHRLGI